jgi:hypothetical protein
MCSRGETIKMKFIFDKDPSQLLQSAWFGLYNEFSEKNTDYLIYSTLMGDKKEIEIDFPMQKQAGKYHFKFFHTKEATNPKISNFIICGPRVDLNLGWVEDSNCQLTVKWKKKDNKDTIVGSWIGLYGHKNDLNHNYIEYFNIKSN